MAWCGARTTSTRLKDAAAHRLAAADRCGDVDRPELGCEAALPAAREVRVQVLMSQLGYLDVPLGLPQIKLREAMIIGVVQRPG